MIASCCGLPTFTLAGDLVPQHVDLVHAAELLEHLAEIVLVHGARDLPYEHLDEVGVRLLRNAAAVVHVA